ncbi:MAG: fatty acid desaturase [Rhodobacteraceae bacterium]|nr:fatty acid desaturase [Paracoccaceae bacterium]
MKPLNPEWPTLALLLACYVVWAFATTILAALWLPLGIAVAAVATAFFGSLQHEATHGHPTANPMLNAALVFPGLTLVIPFLRFRDTHLDHHHDSRLTDPYDDPESNFLDPAVWARLPRPMQVLCRFNNTLLGRLIVGPALGTAMFFLSDLRAARSGDRRVLRGWLWHIPALVPVIWWFTSLAVMPFWAYAIAVYGALSLLRIRTFLEHRADALSRNRTVVIEDRGPLSWLFLNNNLHKVHHMHPRVPWYRLPGLYAANPGRYLACNGHYHYASYAEIFRRHLLKPKDPVAHPLSKRG